VLQAVSRVVRRTTLVGVVALSLQACGGGGGGGGSPNPVIGTSSFKTNENVALTTSLTATDPGNSSVTFAQTSNPTSGTVSGFTSAGAFVYTPNPKFTGSDSFGVTATDANGHATTGTVSITVTVDTPPTANNTIVRVDGSGLASINVLANANDPDKDPLTVSIVTQPPDQSAGVATVNSDGTISLANLSNFKGVTRFTYQVKDPSGKTANATAVIFVGDDPFRAAFVGDSPGNGSNEVYLTDFAADPVVETAATRGNLRLAGFAISDNGSTIVYRTQDTTSAANTSLSLVKTSAPTQATTIALPSGTVPIADANGKDQFVVSPDGQWIAMIAGQGNLNSLYVVNIAQPGTVSQIQPTGSTAAQSPVFSLDSKSIYFLATGSSPGTHLSVYFASLSTPLSSPIASTLISALADTGTQSDGVTAFSVSPDQTRILLQAIRGGKSAVLYVNAANPAVEIPINDNVLGQSVGASTVGLPAGRGGSSTVAKVAYVVEGVSLTHPAGIYVADVSSTPTPLLEVQSSTAQIIGLRPDDGAFLYSDGNGSVAEAVTTSTPGITGVGGGDFGWYDSTGNIVLLHQSSPFPKLSATERGSFGTSNGVGTSSLAVDYNDVSGFDRGVAVIGQGPTSGTAPTEATLQLVNALAPQALFPLASFNSPLALTSYSSKIVAAAAQ
jgi:Bacterial Ig domain